MYYKTGFLHRQSEKAPLREAKRSLEESQLELEGQCIQTYRQTPHFNNRHLLTLMIVATPGGTEL